MEHDSTPPHATATSHHKKRLWMVGPEKPQGPTKLVQNPWFCLTQPLRGDSPVVQSKSAHSLVLGVRVVWRWVDPHCDSIGVHGADQCRCLLACQARGYDVAGGVGDRVSVPFSCCRCRSHGDVSSTHIVFRRFGCPSKSFNTAQQQQNDQPTDTSTPIGTHGSARAPVRIDGSLPICASTPAPLNRCSGGATGTLMTCLTGCASSTG